MTGVQTCALPIFGRKVDEQITTQMAGTTQTTRTITVTTSNSVRNGLLTIVRDLDSNDVPNDGMRFGAMTPTLWAMACTVQEFASADWIDYKNLPLLDGAPVGGARYKEWAGVKWLVHSGLPGVATSSANVYVWHHDAVGYASNEVVEGAEVSVKADITWHGDRAAWFINHMMSGEAALIDDTGVIEGVLDDTAAIPTT